MMKEVPVSVDIPRKNGYNISVKLDKYAPLKKRGASERRESPGDVERSFTMADEKRTLVTEEGLRKLQEQYDELVNVRRKQIIEAIEIARGFGDLSENAEYTEARNEQAKNEAEITRLKAIIDNAVVVSESEISTDRVSVGTTVRYANKATGKESEYAIVGADEADPENGSISSECPIGMALLGHKVGESVEVETPRGNLTLTIVDIHR